MQAQGGAGLEGAPIVSVIVPCYNERGTIERVLEGVAKQTYPTNKIEIIVADGMSNDGTRAAVEDFAQGHPGLWVRLVDNPKRIIPAALNVGIEAARGEVLIRLDAHAVPRPDYIERCLAALERIGAANAGGAWDIEPAAGGWLARSIAVAAGNPLGAGDARYRTGGQAGEVETVPFGAFRREWIRRVGPFDEGLQTNEDYEFNLRLRRAGGKVWFDPEIRSTYFARPDLDSLCRQYARYGYWKARVVLRDPAATRWRQVLPPLFVLSITLMGIGAAIWPLARFLFVAEIAVYLLVTLAAAGLEALRRRDAGLLAGFAPAVWTMHFAWGASFWWGLLTGLAGGALGRSRT